MYRAQCQRATKSVFGIPNKRKIQLTTNIKKVPQSKNTKVNGRFHLACVKDSKNGMEWS